MTVDQLPVRQSTNAPALAPPTTTIAAAKSKENATTNLGLTSIIGVESLDTSSMNVLK